MLLKYTALVTDGWPLDPLQSTEVGTGVQNEKDKFGGKGLSE